MEAQKLSDVTFYAGQHRSKSQQEALVKKFLNIIVSVEQDSQVMLPRRSSSAASLQEKGIELSISTINDYDNAINAQLANCKTNKKAFKLSANSCSECIVLS